MVPDIDHPRTRLRLERRAIGRRETTRPARSARSQRFSTIMWRWTPCSWRALPFHASASGLSQRWCLRPFGRLHPMGGGAPRTAGVSAVLGTWLPVRPWDGSAAPCRPRARGASSRSLRTAATEVSSWRTGRSSLPSSCSGMN